MQISQLIFFSSARSGEPIDVAYPPVERNRPVARWRWPLAVANLSLSLSSRRARTNPLCASRMKCPFSSEGGLSFSALVIFEELTNSINHITFWRKATYSNNPPNTPHSCRNNLRLRPSLKTTATVGVKNRVRLRCLLQASCIYSSTP
jgi:hypothetical protein